MKHRKIDFETLFRSAESYGLLKADHSFRDALTSAGRALFLIELSEITGESEEDLTKDLALILSGSEEDLREDLAAFHKGSISVSTGVSLQIRACFAEIGAIYKTAARTLRASAASERRAATK